MNAILAFLLFAQSSFTAGPMMPFAFSHFSNGPRATYLGTDTTTQGNWVGVYGSQGFNIFQDQISYPPYASVTFAGDSIYVWDVAPANSQSLVRATNHSLRIAATEYSGSSFTAATNISDGQIRKMTLYFLDYDSTTRVISVTIRDAANNVLDTRVVSNYSSGTYMSWSVRGAITFTFTCTGGVNATVSGIFFD